METWNLELCFDQANWSDQAKFEQSSISRAILLGFLCSLVSAIQCEANKSNRLCEERPIGSCTVKMLRDLWCRASGLAKHVAAVKARPKVSLKLVVAWYCYYCKICLKKNVFEKRKKVLHNLARPKLWQYITMVDMKSRIKAHTRLRYGSLENATCVRGTYRVKLNTWRQGENLDCSVYSDQFLAFNG